MNALARVFALFALIALSGCGGGGIEAGVGSGGSGAPMSVGVGPVTGFGSVIVNGQRYDETSAVVLLDERPDRTTPATVAALRLGTRVELQHRNFVVSTATVAAELVGPVASVSASRFEALGQVVVVNGDPARPTAFEGFDTLADLAGGAIVEVHGDRDGTGQILATRVELKPAGYPLVRVAGTADAVNGRRFAIAGLAVDAAGATILPAGATLANGQRVVAWTDVPYTGGALVAKIVRIGATALPNDAAVTLDGVVGAFQSPASFRVTGVPVDASGANFVGGSAADLANGRPVRVSGTAGNGVVAATRVEFLQAAQAEVQLTGAITDFVDASIAFRIRNTLLRVSAQTTYQGGAAGNLGNGVMVRARGPLVGGVVQALTVDFLPVTAGDTDTQRVVSGRIDAPVSPVAGDGSRTFRVESLAVDVRTTGATVYRNGSAADLTLGRQVRVEGRSQGAVFVAEEVEFLDNPASPPTVQIDGVAGNVRPDSVVVNGERVRLDNATTYTLDGAPTTSASLRNGMRVEIVATRTDGVLTAASVDIRPAMGGPARIRGTVSGRTPPGALQFLVGGQRVSVAGNPQLVPGNRTLADIVNGIEVEVEGTIESGVLNATRVKFR